MLIHFLILNQLSIPGMKPAWPWCVAFCIRCWIHFAGILLRIVASMFIRDTVCSLPGMSFSDFGIRVAGDLSGVSVVI